VNAAKDSGGAAQIFGLTHFIRWDGAARDKARDQIAFWLNKVNDLRPNANGRGGHGRGIFVGPINAEQVDVALTPAQLAFKLERADGKPFLLAELPRDTIVFLNLWATWCPPCRDELPSLLALRQQLGDRRFVMVGVSYDDSWDDIRKFFAGWLGAIPSANRMFVVRDPAGASSPPGTTLRELFGTAKLPDTYILYNGHVLARFVDARQWTSPAIIEYFKQLAPRRE
jgi:thiol-disulfide isomerase/thioredoxin